MAEKRKRRSARAEAHDFDKVKELEGYLRLKESGKGEHNSKLYTIEMEDGTRKLVWGRASLDDQFSTIPVGTYVWITFNGLKKSKNGKEYKDFTVDFDPESIPQEPEIDFSEVPEEV